MRNVWFLPTIAGLTTWLRRSGFGDIEVVDQSVTTTDEQRATEWMTFESLREALDPDDPGRTVEGWPAPRRVVVIANAL
jgi:tRNA (mo5U34)-methyltransferase